MKSLVAAVVVFGVLVVLAAIVRVFALVLGDWFWPVCLVSLGLTVVFLILNYVSGRGPEE